MNYALRHANGLYYTSHLTPETTAQAGFTATHIAGAYTYVDLDLARAAARRLGAAAIVEVLGPDSQWRILPGAALAV